MRQGRILHSALGAIQWAMMVAAALIVLGWLVGRFLTDRFAWSQWLWWIPTLAALAGALLLTLLVSMPWAWGRADRGRRRLRATGIMAIIFIAIAVYFFVGEYRFLGGSSPRDADADASATPSPANLTIVHWNLGQMPPPRQRAAHAEALFAMQAGADILILTAPNGIRWHESLYDFLREGEQMIQLGKFVIITRFPVGAPAFLAQEHDQQITALPFDTRAALGRGLVLWMADFPSQPRTPRMQFARTLRDLIDQRGLPAPDVVLGDFNLTRGSASIDTIFDGFNLHHAYADAGRGYTASFPRAPLPLWHIDHIFLGPHLEATEYEVFDPAIGRHKAQRATLRVAE